MGRLMALDIGRKRTGIAVTDILKIVPGGLGYQPTGSVVSFVQEYVARESVDMIVVGHPRQSDYSDSESMRYIVPVVNRLKKVLPGMKIVQYDERYTSVLAHKAIIDSGVPMMKRREKGMVDEVSAVIILRDFMESKAYRDILNPTAGEITE